MVEVGTKKILLVEDEPLIAIKEAETLHDFGYDVIPVYTGKRAIEIVQEQFDFDLILMDIDLGRDFDGAETAKSILSEQEIPVVFLTNHFDQETVKKIDDVTHYGYVVKSAGKYVMLDSVKMALRLFQAKQELASEKKVLTEKEEELRSIYDYSPIMLLLLDKKRVIKKANVFVTEKTGEDADSIEGQRFGCLMHCVNIDMQDAECGETEECKKCKIRRIVSDTLKNGRTCYKTETTLTVQPNGKQKELTFLASTTKLEQKDGTMVLMALADITERIATEKELAKTKNMVQAIIENAPVPIFLKDAQGKFLFVNPVNLKLWKLKPEEIIGKTDFDVWEKELAEKYRESDTYVIEHRKTHVTEETVTFRTGTRHIWKIKFPLYDGEGKIWAVAGIATDITELKRREEELSELAKTNEQLMVEVNHRITNNLANIMALARIELSAYGKSKEESITGLIGRIQAVEMIHEKLYRTRNFSKITISRYLEDLSESIIKSYSTEETTFGRQYRIEELRLSTKTATTLGIITAELLINTMKYAECDNHCEVSLSLYKQQGNNIYVYRDNGTGLPKHVRRIEDLKPGTGLLLIKELIKGISGTITLNTENGTEFSIVFPAEIDEN